MKKYIKDFSLESGSDSINNYTIARTELGKSGNYLIENFDEKI